MAKEQKRGNREMRKPKAARSKSAVPAALVDASAVNALMRKPKGKL
jgi:hypothetical protein